MGLLRFGIDVGGTFTDVVAYDEADGRLRSCKVPTVPGAQERSVLDGIAALAGGQPASAIVHGTTVVTNAILEGRIAEVALVMTHGFRDVLEISRQNRESLYELERPGRPAPLVPRQRRFELDERVTFDGRVLREPSEAALRALAERVRACGAEAVAICLLHAYANPRHERRVSRALAGALAYVCASSEVNAEFREYERASTTVLNAAVMPVVDRYLAGLGGALAAGGIRAPLHLVQSSGGMLSDELARRLPVRLVMSGPAAGVAAAQHVARRLGLSDALTFDMGGTSADICLIAGGRIETVRQRTIDGRPIRLPSVAVESIGAGGGSVAWLDPTGALKVGPRSAGAEPGPASYGRGGVEPTVSDANVVLGYLRPGGVFGGSIRLDRRPAEEAIDRLARALGLSLHATAAGILRIADTNMLRALRLVSVQQGHDLRRFSLIAYGGAGPLHAARLARELGMPRVIVPAESSVFSAFGCLVSDLRYDAARTHRAGLADLDLEAAEASFRELEVEATAPLRAEGYDRERIVVRRAMDLRYSGQNYELEVPVTIPLEPAAIAADFNALHCAHYTYSTDEDVACVNLRVVASVPSSLGERPARTEPGSARPIAEQPAVFEGTEPVAAAVYRRADLGAQPILGPALVEDEQSTTVVLPGMRAWADRFANLHLESAP